MFRRHPRAPVSPTLKALHTKYEALAHEQFLHVDVLSDGPITSRVAIVGEGPGETEVRSGIPWSGGAGALLWNSLRPHGLHRVNTYVTNVVKRQISLSRKGDEKHVVLRDELSKWIGMLKWELARLPNCDTVLCLGNYAIEALLGVTGITLYRGSVFDIELPNGKMGKVVCAVNPAYCMRDRSQEPMFIHDCWKLALVDGGKFVPHDVEALINPSYKEALDFIGKMKADKRGVSYDIETINHETACHGIANSPNLAMCINLRDLTANRYTVKEELAILYALQDLFDFNVRTGRPNIAQNGLFDSSWIWRKDYLRFQCTHDTLLAHHLLYPTLPHKLAYLTAQYTLHPFYKDEGKTWREGGDVDKFWRYNCKDAALTYAIAMAEVEELKAEKLDKLFTTHVMRLQPHCVAATVHGVAVDLEAKEQAIEQSAKEVERLGARVLHLVRQCLGEEDYQINIDSYDQMKVVCYDMLNLQGAKGRSLDKHNRKRIRDHSTTPIMAKELLTAYDTYVTEAKYFGTFATVRLDIDDRIRCEYKQYGTTRAPGRTSSSRTLDGIGQNMQNQPPAARHMYVADYKVLDKPYDTSKKISLRRSVLATTQFFYFDGSQAEARIVAYRANIPEWKEQFERARKDGSYDCHRALASEMFKVPYEEVPKKDHDENNVPTIRYVSKRCRHGLNYRMGPDKLAETTGLSYYKSRQSYIIYHKLTPELRKWWRQAEADFRRTKVCYNAFGRPLSVVQRVDDDVLSSIVAFYPQSTIGDWKNRIWYQAEEDDDWPVGHARIALDVHDSLTGIAEPKYLKTALRICKKYAETPILIQDAWYGTPEPLIIPAECKVSTLDIRDKKTKKVIRQDQFHRWDNLVPIDL